MDLVELLQGVRTSLDELAQTDGFQSFKEASAKVSAAKTALFTVMEQCGAMVDAMADDKAKALAAETIKESHVSKADHDKALADLMEKSVKAVEDAKSEWDKEQADKDAKATVIAARVEKLREAKVEKIPADIQAAIEAMSDDEDGSKAFDAMIETLGSRRKACDEAKVVLSENVDSHIVQTLTGTDESFAETLELWKSLSEGKMKASKGKETPFVPGQGSTDGKKLMRGAC